MSDFGVDSPFITLLPLATLSIFTARKKQNQYCQNVNHTRISVDWNGF